MLKIAEKIIPKRVTWKLINTSQVNHHFPFSHTKYTSCNISTGIREYSSKPICPPNAKTKASPKYQQEGGGRGGGGKLFLALGALVLAGGATIGYAKYDKDFRRTLTTYVPFTESILSALDKNNSFSEMLSGLYQNAKKSILGAVSKDGSGTVSTGKKQEIPEPKEYKAPPPIVPALEKEVKPPQESYSEIRVEKKDKDAEESKFDIVGEARAKPECDTKLLAQLEQNICDSATEAVNAYNKAIHVLLSYNQDIEYILDEAVNEVNPDIWESVRRKTKSKNECIRRAEEKALAAVRDVNKLKDLISKPDFNAPENTKTIITNNISKVQDDIEKAKKEFEAELKHSSVNEKYWDKVEKARKNFSEELEILFPNVDISRRKLVVNEEELDLFILHVYANVLFYQKELAKMETILQSRVDQAVESARRGGLEPLTMVQICEAVEQEKRRLTICFQQQVLKLRKEAEIELREQLKRQSQAFNDHLNEAIKVREVEIERLLSRKFDEQLEEERCRFKMQLSTMTGRLRGLDEAIRERNNADSGSRQAQALYSACQSLLRAVRAGCPGVPWKDQIRPLEPELNALVRAATPDDELVSAVIDGIPKEARERGVYPEDALRERFLKVEKVARMVDLLPAEGAALPVHILSMLQGMLLIKSPSPIPQAELNNEKTDFKKLNTNDILQRARYWLDRGDFTQTLKYMNLLKGASRCVARQWMNEARILLETQQAANTLIAHAAAGGLMYL